ncbi:MAG: polysaccharide deacetylase family protein [Candidatus Pacearchaeota archaeon]|nr:polysaccharide deacetylase family protein [Candidatus Pacearchaeota archaeon]
MTKKIFALRIDLESFKGIKKGLPKILDLLKKYRIKASFYIPMGGESNILELIRYRKELSNATERKIKVLSKIEMLRMVLFPKDFVRENQKILRRIILEGHELGIHGWKHRAWTRGLEEININKHLDLAINKYKKIFGVYPDSFAAPAFNTNKKVIEILDRKKILVISDLEGEKPFKIKGTGIINVPITINGENNSPIIEYLATKGCSDNEIINYLKEKIKENKLATIYIHDIYECVNKISLLENLFVFLKKNKIQVKTIRQIAKNENPSN